MVQVLRNQVQLVANQIVRESLSKHNSEAKPFGRTLEIYSKQVKKLYPETKQILTVCQNQADNIKATLKTAEELVAEINTSLQSTDKSIGELKTAQPLDLTPEEIYRDCDYM